MVAVALTPRQLELLAFIRAHIAERGFCPSYDQMRDAVKLRSKSGIHRLVKGLEERGAIRRLRFRARSIELVESWNDYSRGVREGLLIAKGILIHSPDVYAASTALDGAIGKASELSSSVAP